MRTLERIMHVDDEPDIREVVMTTLEAVGGYTVESFGSGAQALSRATIVAPDLILLDVMMPAMDGPTTLRELRRNEKTAQILVIFMTAKIQESEMRRYRELGAADVIAKPFDVETLCNRIEAIWNGLKKTA